MNKFLDGIKKGIPIGIAYLVVSFTFGVYCHNVGIQPIIAVLMSFTNLTSSGQKAGAELMIVEASILEIALTVFVINIRYVLMSISLSQHLSPDVKTWQKHIFGFGITDEIYAVAIKEKEELTAYFMYGIMILPIIGWTSGTALGYYSSGLFPVELQNAFGIALYIMFMALIIPDCTKSKAIAILVSLSITLSCIFYYVPFINQISFGFRIIIITVLVSSLGAILFPRKEEENNVSSN